MSLEVRGASLPDRACFFFSHLGVAHLVDDVVAAANDLAAAPAAAAATGFLCDSRACRLALAVGARGRSQALYRCRCRRDDRR